MLEMGIIVGIGLLVTLAKLPWRWKLRLTSNPVALDLLVFFALLILHWGTYSGVMVATIGALFCSIVLSAARWLIGYFKKGVYMPGKFNLSEKLQ